MATLTRTSPGEVRGSNAAGLDVTNAMLKLAVPKGRMYDRIVGLLGDAGIELRLSARGYRPQVSLAGIDCKILKPQNVLEMLHAGSRDLGFGGADWVRELGLEASGELVEVLDTGFDPVRLVAAAPSGLLDATGQLPRRPLVIASEYERIAREWISARGCNDRFVRSYGATEVFPPDDADCIIDVAASGDTLRANGLSIVDEVMRSTTRLYANRAAMADAGRREMIGRLALLLRSVLDARGRVMLEVNVDAERLDAVVAVLPCMRQPTIAELRGGAGFAVKVAAPRGALPTLIPEIKARGGTDIVVTELAQLVP